MPEAIGAAVSGCDAVGLDALGAVAGGDGTGTVLKGAVVHVPALDVVAGIGVAIAVRIVRGGADNLTPDAPCPDADAATSAMQKNAQTIPVARPQGIMLKLNGGRKGPSGMAAEIGAGESEYPSAGVSVIEMLPSPQWHLGGALPARCRNTRINAMFSSPTCAAGKVVGTLRVP